MFKRTKICTGVLLALGGTLAATGLPSYAQTQTIEITGSRIKRADAEGALPVASYSREDIDASGAVTVAEFVRTLTFSTDGQFRPQSGSSAQGFSGISLRGLGERRTLVLVDGRRVAKSPQTGQSADVNSIPMAAVERVEVLTDGASAIYGSDAIGGVINFILKKDFEGFHIMGGVTNPSIKGGNRTEASATMGMTSDKGRIIAGVSRTSRDIIWVRDYPWSEVGVSSYANNLYNVVDNGDGTFSDAGSAWRPGGAGTPGAYVGTCDFPDRGFYIDGAGNCRYDFNLVAADEARTSTTSVFARGEIKIAADWNAYAFLGNTRNRSFGRYAPVPDTIIIDPTSVLGTQLGLTETKGLRHRFGAGGNRDNYTDGNTFDVTLGLNGTYAGVDIDAGVRRTQNKVTETGTGYVVKAIATQFINDGTYDVANPFNNDPDVIGSFTTNTARDSVFSVSEVYANAQMSVFKLGGGDARVYVGGEHRRETYQDLYDSLSESGQVLGSSGNSAAGSRKVMALTGELFLPLTKQLEASLAARYEKYSDYGSDFSPKASLRFKASPNLLLRASAGRGFAAPTLDIITSRPAFSADTVVDLRQCLADGSYTPTECAEDDPEFQINGLRISNPNITSEKSTQFSLGAVWDVTPALSLKADYWSTKIKDVISFISAQTIVNRDNGDDPLPIPAGLSITRDPTTGAITQIVSGYANEGTLKYSGIDLSVLYQHKYASLGSFRHELVYSRRLKAETNGVDFNGTFGQPKDRATITNRWTNGSLGLGWNINYIAKNGEGANYAGGYVTHDVQATWATPIKGSTLTVGIVNAGEKFPALVGSPYDQKPFNYYLYDMYGRQFYVRGEMKF
jgi:iron complex outermembrane receptor protein